MPTAYSCGSHCVSSGPDVELKEVPWIVSKSPVCARGKAAGRETWDGDKQVSV